VPFHSSANAEEPLSLEPDASQKLAETQDTPLSVMVDPLAGLGVAWIFHPVPFHASARLTWLPAAL
jgi:hypothetical protein